MMTSFERIVAEGGVELVQGMVIFLVAGVIMVLGGLVLGRFLRPQLPNPEKLLVYECGEPAMGSSWVQFDLRFYVVALVFLVFDVEIALFYPWAVVFGGGDASVRLAALWDMLFFFGVLVVGFVYLWRFGYLDWVRTVAGPGPGRRMAPPPRPRVQITKPAGEAAGSTAGQASAV